MSRSKFTSNRKYPTPPTVVDNLRSHTIALQALIEGVNIGQRRQGAIEDSFVRVGELQDIGLISLTGDGFTLSLRNLDDLQDVDASAPATGEVLTYDGTNWVNSPSASGVSDHEDLTGIQGGTVGEHYHLTAAEYAALGGGDMYGETLNDLEDVSFYMPRDGDLFMYESATGQWTSTSELTAAYSFSAFLALNGGFHAGGGYVDFGNTGLANPVSCWWYNDDWATGVRYWAAETSNTGTQFRISAYGDAPAYTPRRDALTVTKTTGAAITLLEYGNNTDNPSHYFYGNRVIYTPDTVSGDNVVDAYIDTDGAGYSIWSNAWPWIGITHYGLGEGNGDISVSYARGTFSSPAASQVGDLSPKYAFYGMDSNLNWRHSAYMFAQTKTVGSNYVGADIVISTANTSTPTERVRISYDGLVKLTATAAEINDTAPQLRFVENDQAADEKTWRFITDGKIFYLRSADDALATNRTVFSATRGTGAALSNIVFGNSSDYPTVYFYSATLRIEHTAPRIQFNENDQAADEKLWRFNINSKILSIHALNDAGSTLAYAYRVNRGTGAVISSIEHGNTTDNPTTTFLGTGLVTLGGSMELGTDGIITFDEHASAAGTPAAGKVALYAKADGKLYIKDDAGVERDLAASGTGAVGTDTIWDAKGDLAVGTAADTASKLSVGADGLILTADSAEATGLKWASIPEILGSDMYGVSLNDLADVSFYLPNNNDGLVYNSATGKWDVKPVLTDVDMTTTPPAAGALLRFNGANWVPAPVIGATVTRTTTQAITTSADNAIQWTTEVRDDGGCYDAGSNTRLTAPDSGWYMISARVVWAADTGDERYIQIRLNGTGGTYVASASFEVEAELNAPQMNVSAVEYLNVGQYAEIVCWQNDGADVNISSARASIKRIY